MPELTSLVDEVAARSQPYEVRADRGHGRVQGRDGTAWLQLTQGADILIETAGQLAAGCPSDIADDPRRTRSAHLTLARRADIGVIDALARQVHGALGVAWQVDRLELVRSHLEPSGARYETVHTVTL